MRTIHKHQLELVEEQVLNLHTGSVILTAENVGSVPTIWVETETDNSLVEAKFRIYGTGAYIPEHLLLIYINTIFIADFAIHIYLDQTIELNTDNA